MSMEPLIDMVLLLMLAIYWLLKETKKHNNASLLPTLDATGSSWDTYGSGNFNQISTGLMVC